MNFFNSSPMDEYQQLKILVAKGDEAAFRKIFDLLFTNLTQFAFSLVKSKDIATELVDEIFIRLWNKRENILSIENIRIYLYKATKNSSLNYLSRQANRNLYEPFDDINIQLKEEQNPESLMINNEMLNKIRQAVEALPPRCKIIFKLIREDGLKYKEVAEVLNISVKTVDAQMVIAVSQIKEKLKGDFNFSPKKNLQKK